MRDVERRATRVTRVPRFAASAAAAMPPLRLIAS